MRTTYKILIALMTLFPFAGLAHPGHGHGNPLSPDHYFGNPEHSIPITLAIAAVVAYTVWRRKKQKVNK